MTKVIEMRPSNDIESLLVQLEELTDTNSLYYDEDVFNEKEEIRMNILTGKIVLEEV